MSEPTRQRWVVRTGHVKGAGRYYSFCLGQPMRPSATQRAAWPFVDRADAVAMAKACASGARVVRLVSLEEIKRRAEASGIDGAVTALREAIDNIDGPRHDCLSHVEEALEQLEKDAHMLRHRVAR